MKTKTINKVIYTKFDEFLKSINNERVRTLVEKNSIITGGCIASMLLKEPINDFDLYFTNKETVLAVAEYYTSIWNKAHKDDGYVFDGASILPDEYNSTVGVGMNMTPDRVKIIFKSKGIAKEIDALQDSDEVEDIIDSLSDKKTVEDTRPRYRPIYISSNAITLSQQIQIVLRFYGEADTIHQHYDYIHCTNYWLSSKRELFLNQKALEALLSKELVYVGSKYPLASVIRTRKFIKRGWTINAGQYLKMCFQISELDLKNVSVLEDQLIGVDVAYFNMLISAVTTKIENEKIEGREFKLEYGYLASIIDKIF